MANYYGDAIWAYNIASMVAFEDDRIGQFRVGMASGNQSLTRGIEDLYNQMNRLEVLANKLASPGGNPNANVSPDTDFAGAIFYFKIAVDFAFDDRKQQMYKQGMTSGSKTLATILAKIQKRADRVEALLLNKLAPRMPSLPGGSRV